MSVSVETSVKWTYDRMVSNLPPDSRYEIIHNEIYAMPSPNTKHQRISRNLQFKLDSFVQQHKVGELFNAPFDVILDQDNTVQPDIIFVSTANAGIITDRAVEGVPDLLIEIISPSSFYRDSEIKKELYQKYGVKEYWIVDPANEIVEIFTLKDKKYELHLFDSAKGKISSLIVVGLEINLQEIFT